MGMLVSVEDTAALLPGVAESSRGELHYRFSEWGRSPYIDAMTLTTDLDTINQKLHALVTTVSGIESTITHSRGTIAGSQERLRSMALHLQSLADAATYAGQPVDDQALLNAVGQLAGVAHQLKESADSLEEVVELIHKGQ